MTVFFRRRPTSPRRRSSGRNRRGRGRRGVRLPVIVGVALALLLGFVLRGWLSESGESHASPATRRAAAADTTTIVRCLLETPAIGKMACKSALLMEVETGRILWEQTPDVAHPPASLVKMMVELIVFREMEAGRISLADSITTSANASTMGGSQVYLKQGEVQTLSALLDAIVLASANDAAMAVAEHMSGSEESFVARMNEEATRLGLTGTKFANVHGLDLRGQRRNVTTARDIATMARALLEYPLAIELSSVWRKPFRGGEFWLDNTNKLLRRYGGVEGYDGLKTGYTPRAGGCLCGTAEREGVRLVTVILGARPGHPRFHLTKDLMTKAFASRPRWVDVARSGEELRLDGGADGGEGPDGADDSGSVRVLEAMPVAVAHGAVRVLVEEARLPLLGRRLRPSPDLELPLSAGAALGQLDCRIGERTFASVPAVAATRLVEIPATAPVAPPTETR